MADWISNIFSTIFGDNVILATILISVIPIIELRGAIPFATNTGFWGVNALSNWAAYGWALLGSSLIVPVIALIFKPLIKWLKSTKLFGKLASAIENRVANKAQSISGAGEKSERFSKSYWMKILAVFVFVAIPLPLTGVWTGTCVAVFVGLDYVSACLSVMSGNVVAGLLLCLILEFFPWLNDYLFYIFLGIIVLLIVVEIVKYFMKKRNRNVELASKKQQNQSNDENN